MLFRVPVRQDRDDVFEMSPACGFRGSLHEVGFMDLCFIWFPGEGPYWRVHSKNLFLYFGHFD